MEKHHEASIPFTDISDNREYLPPPVYTPFGGLDEEINEHPTNRVTTNNRNTHPRVVQPPNTPFYDRLKKQFNNIPSKTKIIALLIVIFIIILFLIIFNGSRSEFDEVKEYKEKHPIEYTIAEILNKGNLNHEKLTFDSIKKQLFLSSYDNGTGTLFVKNYTILRETDERIDTEEDDYFKSKKIIGSEKYKDCVQYDGSFYCCQGDFKTYCSYESNNKYVINSSVSSAELPSQWQRIDEYGRFVTIHNKRERVLLDVRSGKIYNVEDCCTNDVTLKSYGFYFPNHDKMIVDELVRENNELKLCSYEYTNGKPNYVKKYCQNSLIPYESEYPNIKFCSNPRYIAIAGHEHLEGQLKWKLSFKFWQDDKIYTMRHIDNSIDQRMVLACDPNDINIYVSVDSKIIKYDIKLPNFED